MEISEFNEIYNNKLQIRDMLPSIKEELKELEEQDIIKKYNNLKIIYEENIDLDEKLDEEILKELSKDKIISFRLPTYYVCHGRNLDGGITKTGDYYILPKEYKRKLLKAPVKVALYRNFENPNDIRIIPMKDVKQFEEEHIVTTMAEDNYEEEFFNLRASVISSELYSLKDKQLVKE